MKYILAIFLVLQTACSGSPNSKKFLRVGTTGDYAPFSEKSEGSYKGIDIELAQDLARSMNLKLKLVPTSWPTLIEDLKNNKFDIAMSGISIKPEREKWGYFSYPYVQYGKMPIARCKDVEKLKSLQLIDKKGVRVAVNPGGTNEAYAKKTIKNAEIITFQDNAKIFQNIIDNKADIMMTDSIEVYFQSKKHKGQLCPTMKRPLTQSQMGIYMPKDKGLLKKVNLWLSSYMTSGQLNKVIDKYLK